MLSSSLCDVVLSCLGICSRQVVWSPHCPYGEFVWAQTFWALWLCQQCKEVAAHPFHPFGYPISCKEGLHRSFSQLRFCLFFLFFP